MQMSAGCPRGVLMCVSKRIRLAHFMNYTLFRARKIGDEAAPDASRINWEFRSRHDHVSRCKIYLAISRIVFPLHTPVSVMQIMSSSFPGHCNIWMMEEYRVP